MPKRTLLASDLYAMSQGHHCDGDDECHWCGNLCKRGLWRHDEPPQISFQRYNSGAKRKGNAYICMGCYLYHRKRSCVKSVTGTAWIDGQNPKNHSWFVTDTDARIIKKEDHATILKTLTNPPDKFYLALLSGEPAIRNHLHLAIANDLENFQADDKIHFTLDNQPLFYTVYELLETLHNEGESKEPGSQMLLRILHYDKSDWKKNPDPDVLEAKKRARMKSAPGHLIMPENQPKNVVRSG